eukprot:NODE_697_length_1938_cov_28.579790_g647_i0.p1 GENE.NODE_697_length_1938_cov_28.579790_g647_i0~~NODE_697_length_1938_cov_28.579790_g647_i0.p1  ORF type:complete len:621 (+),score=174.20 NODE_697_length_1938_cov_28.579790_g647_i0:30-1892(+)
MLLRFRRVKFIFQFRAYSDGFPHFPPERIRNFCIIAHIDHGKTTLSDALLTTTGTIDTSRALYLDKLEIEQQRGITVKAQAVSMFHSYAGEQYLLNLIDTPGHVDFTYEVGRSMLACEGALLLVDAAQGVQAQTQSNYELARQHDLTIIPVLTKADREHDAVDLHFQVEALLQHSVEPPILKTSARDRTGITELLDTICHSIPPPPILDGPFKGLLFDMWVEGTSNRIVCMVCVKQGSLRKGDIIMSHITQRKHTVSQMGVMHPEPISTQVLYAGQVGFVNTSMSRSEALIGDTLFNPLEVSAADITPFPGFRKPQPTVFASIYPLEPGSLRPLLSAIDKLTCTDSIVEVKQDTTDTLGQGVRCGFLGVLHMNVFCERLGQEFGTNALITPPTVSFQALKKNGEVVEIRTPMNWVEPHQVVEYREPIVTVTLRAPTHYTHELMQLCEQHRGRFLTVADLHRTVTLQYVLPLTELIHRFYDSLKTITSGYGTMEYTERGYQKTSLCKVDLVLNGKVVESMSHITHADNAQTYARDLVRTVKEHTPRKLVDIYIQATVSGKSIARETVKMLRKDVTAKCYGGDMTRKRKLLDAQKEGKAKLRQTFVAELTHEALLAVMSMDR